MFEEYKLLETITFPNQINKLHPSLKNEVVKLDDLAIEVMTDFSERPIECISLDTNIKDAENKMKKTGVRALGVINKENDIVGFISLYHLVGIRKTVVSKEEGVLPTELTVEMMMIPQQSLVVLDYDILENARVGHIAKLFTKSFQKHIMVISNINDKNFCKGMFSISRLSRQLGIDIQQDIPNNSIYQIKS